jgi:hypothetical protein
MIRDEVQVELLHLQPRGAQIGQVTSTRCEGCSSKSVRLSSTSHRQAMRHDLGDDSQHEQGSATADQTHLALSGAGYYEQRRMPYSPDQAPHQRRNQSTPAHLQPPSTSRLTGAADQDRVTEAQARLADCQSNTLGV